MKELKDYLHLYLGCDCSIGYIKRERINEMCLNFYGEGNHAVRIYGNSSWIDVRMVKPILRPLGDMTEEEEYQYKRLSVKAGYIKKEFDQMTSEASAVSYLLSKHFDLFRLIEAGLAIDKTTLQDNL